ncbi:phosphoribosyl transferase [candidate division WS5 bacterium]|uniref:Phosphoribosyl transferase n=1 Tax=candidate division WS5 bacterium TaxID=2093353 RepID=A0A419DG44_9BACT|nr:MAG: phosphoribosyl transferase [candidate division WS5 bacterium]
MKDVYFRDREDAGRQLAEKLLKYKDEDPVVLALPRGGVVLGDIIAKKLNCPLNLIITRKIGHPMNPEYAIAAITISGELVENRAETGAVDQRWFEEEKSIQIQEAKRREETYLGGRKPVELKAKTAIIVDDGIATGLTMMAAIKEVKAKGPAGIIVAVPVIPFDTYETLLKLVDEVIAISVPNDFLGAVGAYYADFPQVSDEEVVEIMNDQ